MQESIPANSTLNDGWRKAWEGLESALLRKNRCEIERLRKVYLKPSSLFLKQGFLLSNYLIPQKTA